VEYEKTNNLLKICLTIFTSLIREFNPFNKALSATYILGFLGLIVQCDIRRLRRSSTWL